MDDRSTMPVISPKFVVDYDNEIRNRFFSS